MAKQREELWWERTNTPVDMVLKAASEQYHNGRTLMDIVRWAQEEHGLKLAVNEEATGALMVRVEAELGRA